MRIGNRQKTACEKKTLERGDGLAEPGGAVSIWGRVVLESGNEKTSQRVVVQRPN